MEFPRARFQRVGATPTELDAMQAAFDAASDLEQQSFVDRIAPVSDGEVEELLDSYRSRDTDDTPAVEPDPEPEPEQTPAPAKSSASAPADD